jgi:hypothetical protein
MNAIMVALALALALAPSIASAYQNEPIGFRGIEWGSDAENHKEQLTETSRSKEGVEIYRRRDDKMNIGEADLNSIAYVFYRGQFSAAMIRSSGLSNQTALLRALQAQFGSGDQSNRYIPKYFWRGAIANIFMDCNSVTKDCTVVMQSERIRALQNADRQSAAEKSKGDF